MFFGLFGKKQQLAVKTDRSGQPYKLQNAMIEQKLTHDETVLADIPGVRINDESGVPVMYFCGIEGVKVKKQISPGDGQRIPEEVVLESVTINKGFKPGRYNLKNVKLYSNGQIQIIATAGTKFERV